MCFIATFLMEDIQGKVLVQLLAMTILLRWQSDELGLEEQLHHQLVGNCFQHNSHLARGFQASCRQSDKFLKEEIGRFFEKCAEGDCSNESLKWKEAIKHNKSIWNSASSTLYKQHSNFHVRVTFVTLDGQLDTGTCSSLVENWYKTPVSKPIS